METPTWQQAILQQANARPPSASIRLNPILTQHDCETAWDSAAAVANVTTTADASVYKIGSKSAKHVIGASFDGDVVAWAALAASLDLTDGIATHARFWARANAAVAAGLFTFGLDNAADFSSDEGDGKESLDLPAMEADIWYRITLPLNDAQLLLSSVDSIGITASDPDGAAGVTLYIDQVELLKLETSGDEAIVPPVITTLEDEVFVMPFKCSRIGWWLSAVEADIEHREGELTDVPETQGQQATYWDVPANTPIMDMSQAFTSLRIVLASALSTQTAQTANFAVVKRVEA